MKLVAALALIGPSLCFALGADSTAYIGLSPKGKVVRANLISHDERGPNSAWLYRVKGKENLRYCWTNGSFFQCAKAVNAKPTVIYRRDDAMSKAAERDRRELIRRGLPSDGFMDHFVCETGCTEEVPRFVFEVGFDGA